MDNFEKSYLNQDNTLSEGENKDSLVVSVDELFSKKLKFLGTFQQVIGVLGIINGAFICFGIITAVIGVPYILMSMKIFKAGGFYKDSLQNSSGEDLKNGLIEVSNAAKISMILMIIGVVIYVLYLVIIIFILVFAAMENY